MYKAVESVAELKAHWAERGSLRHVVVKGLDLRGETAFLLGVRAQCAVFLGCHMESDALDHVIDTGGVVFPRLRELLDLPFEVYRDRLYSLPELMEGLDAGRPGSLVADTLDGRIYRWSQDQRRGGEPQGILEALAQRLHDHAMVHRPPVPVPDLAPITHEHEHGDAETDPQTRQRLAGHPQP